MLIKVDLLWYWDADYEFSDTRASGKAHARASRRFRALRPHARPARLIIFLFHPFPNTRFLGHSVVLCAIDPFYQKLLGIPLCRPRRSLKTFDGAVEGRTLGLLLWIRCS